MNDLSPEETQAIEAACIRLSNAFAIHLDDRRYEAVVGLFTDDARYRPGEKVYVGHRGVRDYLRSRPETRRSRHVISNHLVDVMSATEARGRCVVVYYADDEGTANRQPAPFAGPRLVADYSDRFVLTVDGWRIAERLCDVIFER